jgi:hypothetical protein
LCRSNGRKSLISAVLTQRVSRARKKGRPPYPVRAHGNPSHPVAYFTKLPDNFTKHHDIKRALVKPMRLAALIPKKTKGAESSPGFGAWLTRRPGAADPSIFAAGKAGQKPGSARSAGGPSTQHRGQRPLGSAPSIASSGEAGHHAITAP